MRTIARPRIALLGAVAVLLIMRARLTAAPLEAPGASTPAPVANLATSDGPGFSCWVTGDLVGDDDPALIAESLCGPRPF